MTDRELLELLVKKIDNLDNKMNSFETDMQSMKADMQSMNNRLDVLETKIDTLEMKVNTLETKTTKTQMLIEHEVIPHIQALAENHADLSRNVEVAKNVDERVGILEFDMKLIKKTLNSYTV